MALATKDNPIKGNYSCMVSLFTFQRKQQRAIKFQRELKISMNIRNHFLTSLSTVLNSVAAGEMSAFIINKERVWYLLEPLYST